MSASTSPAPARLNAMSYIDILKLTEAGSCVVLHMCGQCVHIYHKCPKEEGKEISLSDVRVTSYDVGPSYSDLLLKNRWPKMLQTLGCKQCTCSLKDRVVKITSVTTKINGENYTQQEMSFGKDLRYVDQRKFPV